MASFFGLQRLNCIAHLVNTRSVNRFLAVAFALRRPENSADCGVSAKATSTIPTPALNSPAEIPLGLGDGVE